jgi:hypothetical protein
LHEAARKGRVEVAEDLIRADAQHNIVDRLGQTPLDTAQAANQWGVADLLLRQCDRIGNCGRSGPRNPLPPPAVTSPHSLGLSQVTGLVRHCQKGPWDLRSVGACSAASPAGPTPFLLSGVSPPFAGAVWPPR